MQIRTVLPATICLLLLAFPVSVSSAGVSRSLDIPASGGPVEVTITLPPDSPVAGLVEEIPAGWGYINSSLPADRVRAVGGAVLFAIVDGPGELTYRLDPHGNCSGIFHGTLHDFMNGTMTRLPDTVVEDGRAVTVAVQTEGGVLDGSARQEASPGSPGFGSTATFLAAAAVMALFINRRRGDGR
ncbi:MAG: hypothetical protein ACXQTG_04370 [Methanoculleaceae archaeon]